MTLTGVATTFGQFIVSVGENSLFLSLLLTMVTCIFLGMGIPTIPNYIITSSIAGPALLDLGVPLIVSHMFVFYFGILADLTPPVALACFAAAPIAREKGLKISIEAIKVAAAGFVIPFMAVYTPALMLQDGGPLAAAIGYWPAVAYIVVKTVLAIGLWGVAVIGFLRQRLAVWERLLATAAAFTLVASLPVTDEIGFALAAVLVLALHWWRTRAAQSPPSPAMSLCVLAAGKTTVLAVSGLHAVLDPFGREDTVGGGLDDRRKEPASGRSACAGFRRRHGAGRGRGAGGRLVGLPARAARAGGAAASRRRARRRAAGGSAPAARALDLGAAAGETVELASCAGDDR